MRNPIDVGNGGKNDGSTITSNQTSTMVISWALAAGCPAPDYFEVIAYTGGNPIDTTQWLWTNAVQVTPAAAQNTATSLGTANPYAAQIKYGASAPISNAAAAVRSVYASGKSITLPVRPTPLPIMPVGRP